MELSRGVVQAEQSLTQRTQTVSALASTTLSYLSTDFLEQVYDLVEPLGKITALSLGLLRDGPMLMVKMVKPSALGSQSLQLLVLSHVPQTRLLIWT